MACCIAQPLSAQRSPCETKCGTIFRVCSVRRSPHQQQRSPPARPWVLQRQERSTAAPVCLATGFSQPAGEQESKLPQSRDEAVSREHPPLLLLPLLLSPPRLVHSTSGMPLTICPANALRRSSRRRQLLQRSWQAAAAPRARALPAPAAAS